MTAYAFCLQTKNEQEDLEILSRVPLKRPGHLFDCFYRGYIKNGVAVIADSWERPVCFSSIEDFRRLYMGYAIVWISRGFIGVLQ